MLGILLILAGVYFVAVGFHGNGAALFDYLLTDIKTAWPWIAAVVALVLIYEHTPADLQPAVQAFAILIVIVFVMKNWQALSDAAHSVGL